MKLKQNFTPNKLPKLADSSLYAKSQEILNDKQKTLLDDHQEISDEAQESLEKTQQKSTLKKCKTRSKK